MVRELHTFSTEAGLSEITCLLHQCITFSKHIETGRECGILLAECIDRGKLRMEGAIDRCDIRFKEFFSTFACGFYSLIKAYGIPVQREAEEFILQTAVVAHEVAAAFLEVVEQEVGLTGFEHGTDETTLPVAEEFRAVQHRNLHTEASLLVQVSIDILLFISIEVLITEAEGFLLLIVLRHILEPAHYCHRIRLIAIIYKTCPCIFRRIVWKKTTGNH